MNSSIFEDNFLGRPNLSNDHYSKIEHAPDSKINQRRQYDSQIGHYSPNTQEALDSPNGKVSYITSSNGVITTGGSEIT